MCAQDLNETRIFTISFLWSTLFTLDRQNYNQVSENMCRGWSEYTTLRGGVVVVDRSRDQTKKAERPNEIKTSQTLALKQETLTGIVPARPFPVLTLNCYFRGK